MAHWLLWAYLLEFQGAPVYLAVWAASLAFLAAHVWVICELLTAWWAGLEGTAQAAPAVSAKHKAR